MKKQFNPEIIAPIKTAECLKNLELTRCRNVYVTAENIDDDKYFEEITKLAKDVKKQGFNCFICFKNIVNIDKYNNFDKYLSDIATLNIKGIIVNSYDIIQMVANNEINIEIIIDSGFNIHNLASIDMITESVKLHSINITEEIYTSNLTKIKKIHKKSLSINSDNFPWLAQELIKNNIINYVILKGNFKTTKELIHGVQAVEKIIENPEKTAKKRLPFKNLDNFYYETNHFLGEFRNFRGKCFKFTENIKQFKWEPSRVKLKDNQQKTYSDIPRVILRINSLEHIKYLKKYLKNLKFNPVTGIEYGEIVSTADLKKHSFNKIMEKVKAECAQLNMELQISTPRILIERDFDRVFEYVKELCIQNPAPSRIIANNSGYWWTIVNDPDLRELPIEIGQGISLNSSSSVKFFEKRHSVHAVDLSGIKTFADLKDCLDKIKDRIPIRKITIGGNIRMPSVGLCPLNRDYAILSRLSCAAPCHNGNFAISDPSTESKFPFTVDGFCRMHLFKDSLLDNFKYLKAFEKAGINEFVLDLSSLPPQFIPVLLTKFLNAQADKTAELLPEDAEILTGL